MLGPSPLHEHEQEGDDRLPEVKLFAPEKIRNVALVGHGGSGKTTLAEALLHEAGATTRVGRVEDGTTVCDFDPEEQARHMSLSLAVAPFEWKGHKVNLIDTPGYADFVADVDAALRVADLAVFVVSAVEGVEVQTEAIWRMAAAVGVPRMFFINKLDRERASFDRTLDALRDRFGAGVAPLELPIGAESGFVGVADLLTDTAWTYRDGVATHGEIPDEMEAREHEVHDNLVEGIVVADDDLLAGYLDGEVPSVDQLEHTLAVGVDDATVFPVVCGSGLHDVAIDRLADFICEIGPSPLDRPPVEVMAGDRLVEVDAASDGPPLVRCSRPWPTSSSATCRCSRSCRARPGRRPPGEPPHRRRRAAARPAHDPRPRAGAGGGRARGRPRRRRQAERHRHRRHPRAP